MSEHPHKSHDEFFKASFGRLDIARDYLEQLLPSELSQILDLAQLERVNGAWVTPELEEYFSDVVYRCPLKGNEKPVFLSFLFEHKSSPDTHPHIQLLQYLVDGWQEQRKQKQPLTPIIPIVVYHGMRKWQKRDLSAYFGKGLPASVLPFLPRFDYVLTRVQDMQDEQILELKKGLLINALLMFKHIWQPEFILDRPELIFIHLEEWGEQENEFVVSLLAYFFKKSEIAQEKVNQFIKKISVDLNQTAMSTYDMIQAEGIAKGIIQGVELEKREFILKLWSLKEFSLEKISFLVGVSTERVIEVILEFLQKEGLSEGEAKLKVEQFKPV